jgi:hypothetical protein
VSDAPAELLDFAVRYARRGLYLFPVGADHKKPVLPHSWQDYATRDIATLKSWAQLSHIVWAVKLPSSVVVVDIDPKRDGFATFARLTGSDPDAFDTLQCSTPSGGRHLWFDADGHRFHNSQSGKLGQGLDVKTVGGYVAVPPGPGRRWLRQRQLMIAPEWLKSAFATHERASTIEANDADEHSTSGLTLLLHFLELIRNAPIGTRGSTRNAYAYAIGGLVGGGELEANCLAWTV